MVWKTWSCEVQEPSSSTAQEGQETTPPGHHEAGMTGFCKFGFAIERMLSCCSISKSITDVLALIWLHLEKKNQLEDC